jgi:hypothetical protein
MSSAGFENDTKSLLSRSINGPFSVLSMSKLKGSKVSKNSGMSENSMISTKKKRQSEYFKKKLIEMNINVVEKLPCSFEALEEAGDMIVVGESKLEKEYTFAASVPNRKVIDKF